MKDLQDLSFTCQGFHPSNFMHSYLHGKLSELLEESPYGATLRATFSRNGPSFKGRVRIYSSAGNFFAIASGKRAHDVCRKLTDQIRRQLGKWRAHRFERESVRQYAHQHRSETREQEGSSA